MVCTVVNMVGSYIRVGLYPSGMRIFGMVSALVSMVGLCPGNGLYSRGL